MAVNKNALIRYKILDRCFSNPGKKYFIEDLVFECNRHLMEIDPNSTGIQKRQLFEDIKYMESAEGWSAEIGKITFGKKKYYRYTDKTFSINKTPLNAAEIEQLHSAMDIISRFKGMPQFEWINEFSPKLEQAFTLDAHALPIISFDSNEYLKGVEYISELFHAVLYKKVLQITYQSFKSDKAHLFVIHPYYLKQYNNRWFLFGRNEQMKRLTNLALDRITSIEDYNLIYHENSEFDFNEYFEDIIGVTKPDVGTVEKIVLSVSAELLPYLETKPIHGSQKTAKVTPEGMTIELNLIINYELVAKLFSFGDGIKVLEPQLLAKTMAEKALALLNKYK